MPPLWLMRQFWVSKDNGSEGNCSDWEEFEAISENMLVHESSRLAPKAELVVSELSTCACISEMEADEIFIWLAPMVTTGLATGPTVGAAWHKLVFSIAGLTVFSGACFVFYTGKLKNYEAGRGSDLSFTCQY